MINKYNFANKERMEQQSAIVLARMGHEFLNELNEAGAFGPRIRYSEPVGSSKIHLPELKSCRMDFPF